MTDHFGFTKLVVDDLERCAVFYSKVFGLTETIRVSDDIAGRRIDEIMYQPTSPGGSSFVLLRFPDEATTGPAGVIPGFITTDIEALVERAVAAGGTVIEPPLDRPAHGVTTTFIEDPEGRLIEVVQMLTKD